ncbi:MAG: hypothetical protein OXM55_05940 [Bdellovibrionales bacterium]|nr:hypothetical protein [Bdellovibrionales bacterium]
MNLSNQETQQIKACSITFSNEENIIAKRAIISEVTTSGFKLILNYRNLVPDSLKFQLHLNTLWYKNIRIYIPDMEMDWEGKVVGTQHLGKGCFEVNIEFFQEVPNYWRECLFELWPKPI